MFIVIIIVIIITDNSLFNNTYFILNDISPSHFYDLACVIYDNTHTLYLFV